MSKYLPFVLTLLVILSSCLRRDEFSNIPEIKYKEMYREDQSIWIKFSFTDGDGDIGLRDDMVYPPFGPCDEHYFNLIVDPYRTDNGEFVIARKPVISDCSTDSLIIWDTVGYDQRIKYIDPESSSKTLEGEIDVKLNEVLNEFPGDTILFRLRLLDRALNESNEIETDILITL